MHQIVCWLGLCPDPIGGAFSTPTDPLAVFTRPTSNGRGEEGRGGEEEMRGRGRDKREGGSLSIALGRKTRSQQRLCYRETCILHIAENTCLDVQQMND